MKKITVLFFSLMMVFSLTACGSRSGNTDVSASTPANSSPVSDLYGQGSEKDASAPAEESAENQGGKILVVYYSATGNTEEVAGFIAAATGADTFELVPAEPYSAADLNWTDRNSRVSREHDDPGARTVELVEDTAADWASYDTVFIGYPIWWGIAAWPVDGFITANDFSGKTVIPFCTSSTSGLGGSGRLLAEAAGTGNWLEGQRFRSGVAEEDVKAWVDSLGIS